MGDSVSFKDKIYRGQISITLLIKALTPHLSRLRPNELQSLTVPVLAFPWDIHTEERRREREVKTETGNERDGRMAWQQKKRDRAKRAVSIPTAGVTADVPQSCDGVRNLFLVELLSESSSTWIEPISIQHRGSFTSSHNRQEKAQLTNMKIKIFACLYTCEYDHTWHGSPLKSQNWLQLVLYWWATSRGLSTGSVCTGGREEWRESASGPVHTYSNVWTVARPAVACCNLGAKKVLKNYLENIIIIVFKR